MCLIIAKRVQARRVRKLQLRRNHDSRKNCLTVKVVVAEMVEALPLHFEALAVHSKFPIRCGVSNPVRSKWEPPPERVL